MKNCGEREVLCNIGCSRKAFLMRWHSSRALKGADQMWERSILAEGIDTKPGDLVLPAASGDQPERH